MVIAIMMECDVKLSDDLLEAIIDKVIAEFDCVGHLLKDITNERFVTFSGRHLLTLMPTKTVESTKKNGRLLLFDIQPS